MSTTTASATPRRPAKAASPLALLGGKPAITQPPGDLFAWPIITAEDEAAVLDVLRRRDMSGIGVTKEFEKEFAAWMGVKYALAVSSGTAAMLSAHYGAGVGRGDEIICSPITAWSSCLPVFSLGATVVFADIDPNTMCIDASKIERHISPHTKAIVVVHYFGHPADMDAIMAVAKKHKLKVIEDVSHAQGGLYKGKRLGSFGDVSGYSLMSIKSFAIGEGGILTTDDRETYDRAVAFGHYERYTAEAVETPYLKPFAGLPLGGYKLRMHQLSSAVGRVQLKYYDKRCAEIRKSLNHFWDLLEGVPGIRPHRVSEKTGSNMGGWYSPRGFYNKEELGGLSISRFCEAVRAEGFPEAAPGCNLPLHTHPVMNDADVYGHGKPTRIAHSDRDLRQPVGSLPEAERIGKRVFAIPSFKHYRPDVIAAYAEAYRKAALNAAKLKAGDEGDPPTVGAWRTFKGV